MAQSQENQGVTPFCTFLSVKDGSIAHRALKKAFHPKENFQLFSSAISVKGNFCKAVLERV